MQNSLQNEGRLRSDRDGGEDMTKRKPEAAFEAVGRAATELRRVQQARPEAGRGNVDRDADIAKVQPRVGQREPCFVDTFLGTEDQAVPMNACRRARQPCPFRRPRSPTRGFPAAAVRVSPRQCLCSVHLVVAPPPRRGSRRSG
jgi:hypothetical protein